MTEDIPRHCPVCREELVLMEVEGIEVDVCDQHGVWLDHGELGRLMELKDGASEERRKELRVARLQRLRQRRQRRRREERDASVAAALFS